jgi:hypothetical protein
VRPLFKVVFITDNSLQQSDELNRQVFTGYNN